MQVQTYDVSILTKDIVSLVQSNSSKKFDLVEQTISSLDEKYATQVISTCLDNLVRIDDSLQQLFINTILNQNNGRVKKALTHVLLRKLDNHVSQ